MLDTGKLREFSAEIYFRKHRKCKIVRKKPLERKNKDRIKVFRFEGKTS